MDGAVRVPDKTVCAGCGIAVGARDRSGVIDARNKGSTACASPWDVENSDRAAGVPHEAMAKKGPVHGDSREITGFVNADNSDEDRSGDIERVVNAVGTAHETAGGREISRVRSHDCPRVVDSPGRSDKRALKIDSCHESIGRWVAARYARVAYALWALGERTGNPSYYRDALEYNLKVAEFNRTVAVTIPNGRTAGGSPTA